jgi:hypothetical protein
MSKIFWQRIKPIGKNKSRKGYRGDKLRYSVFKAEYNQKWLPIEKEILESLCNKYDLISETFFDPKDNPNKKYWHALFRCEKAISLKLKEI